jgi:probable F420-dependent oxidoreductase
MRIGMVQIIDGEPGRGLEFIQGTATRMEELGFAHYWAPDHVVFFDRYLSSYPHSDDGTFGFKQDQGLLEPMMVLQAAAAVTTRMELGTSVEIITERNPVVRAKHVATLDHFSDGRFLYGVGIGWSKEEYAAVGVPWENRGARADEYIQAMDALWTQHRASFHGEFVNFDDVVAFPKPVRQPRPPVLIGGITRPALRRTAMYGDGWYGWKLSLEEIDQKLVELDEELAAVGRDRDDVRLLIGLPHAGDPADLRDYVDAVAARGFDDFVIGASLSRSRYEEQLEAYARALPLGADA